MCSQHGPAALMLKHCPSTLAGTCGGGTGRCVRTSPGTARRTSSEMNFSEHTLTSCGVLVITSASPARERTSRIQRDRCRCRGSTTVPQKYGAVGVSVSDTQLVG